MLVRICNFMTIERRAMLMKALLDLSLLIALLYGCVVIEVVIMT